MKGTEVMEYLLECYPDGYFISTNGYTTRDLFNLDDSERNFYVVGSMGMASAIALGIALVHKDKNVIILDGDGALLMNYGIMPMLAQQNPQKVIHVVLDNGLHESTGGQRTVSVHKFDEVAKVLGYQNALKIQDNQELSQIKELEPGLTMLHCLVEKRSSSIGKRVEPTPEEIVQRFKSQLVCNR